MTANLPEPVRSLLWEIPYGPGFWMKLRESPYAWVRRWNTILQVTEFNCNNDAIILLETALPALGQLFLALIGFDWDDIARGFLRPMGLRQRRTTRTGDGRKKRNKRKSKWFGRIKFEIPEIGELIGKNIPGAKLIRARQVSPLGRALWVIDGLAQRAVYHWMVIDVFTEFYYNWMSGFMTSRRCDYGGNGGFRCEHATLTHYAPADWIPIGCPNPDDEWGTKVWFGDHAEIPSDAGTFIFAANWEPLFELEAISVEFGLMYDWPEGRVVERTGFLTELKTYDNAAILVDRPPAGTRIYPVVRTQGRGTLALKNIFIAGGY